MESDSVALAVTFNQTCSIYIKDVQNVAVMFCRGCSMTSEWKAQTREACLWDSQANFSTWLTAQRQGVIRFTTWFPPTRNKPPSPRGLLTTCSSGGALTRAGWPAVMRLKTSNYFSPGGRWRNTSDAEVLPVFVQWCCDDQGIWFDLQTRPARTAAWTD